MRKIINSIMALIFAFPFFFVITNVGHDYVEHYCYRNFQNGHSLFNYMFTTFFIMIFISYGFLRKSILQSKCDNLEDVVLSETNREDCGQINRIKEYRNSSMRLMSNEKAAELYKDTAWIDGLDNNDSKQTKRAKDYINSTLRLKSNEAGLDWLRGE